MLNKIKIDMLNLGLKFMTIDDNIVRMFLETASSNVNEIVILPAVKITMKKIIRKLRNKRVHGRVYNGELNGVKVSVIRSLVGSPVCAITLECLKRCQTKIIVRVDFCGGINIVNKNNHINIGDILIPNLAYCGEGTSPHYIIKHSGLINQLNKIENPFSKILDLKVGNQNVFISKPNEDLKSLLLKEGNFLHSNIVKEVDLWSTDALFCESYAFINSLKSINVQGIDMESSILFLLGILFNLKTASVLSVSDLPGNPEYDMFKSNKLHPNMEKGINNAIDLVIKTLPKIKSFV